MMHESESGPPTAAPAAERRGGFQGYFRRASGEVPRQSLTLRGSGVCVAALPLPVRFQAVEGGLKRCLSGHIAN
jgi:hypothetical protein